jgi:hypothetical protein
MDIKTGRFAREDDSFANIASVLSPKPINFESIALSSIAETPLTAVEYEGAVTALITVETAPVRMRMDGTAPTATVGTLLNAGDVRLLTSPEQIAGFQEIAVDADATIMVEYGV